MNSKKSTWYESEVELNTDRQETADSTFFKLTEFTILTALFLILEHTEKHNDSIQVDW